jgi:hypothetical protein
MADTSDPLSAPQAQVKKPRKLLFRSKRGFIRFIDPRNVIGFLWLGPALAILILNFRNYIIGSGLNCRSHCRIDPYSTSQVQQIERLDSTNRDVLGALQFVAKGLEVWFMYVAASFIYILAVHISVKDDRLPVSLLLVYAEFMDLLYLKDLAMRIREFLKEKRQTTSGLVSAPPRIHPWILYSFIFVVACLCAIANLMGVATATLVLPGLQWIDINVNDSIAFDQLLSAYPPRGRFIRGCQPGDLSSGFYSCTSNLYASSLDQLISSAVATERHLAAYGSLALPPVTQESELSLSPNISDDAGLFWAPSRQVAREFSADLANYYVTTLWSETYPRDYTVYPDSRRFNQSLRVQLQRTGPTIGFNSDCWSYEGPRVFRIADDRTIRCYSGLFDNQNNTATKCIRWGNGWDDAASASSASFTVADDVTQLDINVTVYSTPRARYLYDTNCFQDASCDWDRIFNEPAAPEVANISDSQQTYEYASDFGDRVIWCDYIAWLSFATYAVDPSPVSNSLHLAQLGVLHARPDIDTEDNRGRAATLNIHADWILAAWSINATNGRVDGSRGASRNLVIAYQRFISDPAVGYARFGLIHIWTTMQAASLIPYTTRTLSTSSDRSLQREHEANNPYTAATLTSWATVQIWKYGIDSRTKTLGAVILIIGIVIVLATTLMWIESPQSPTRVVVAALFQDRPVGLQEKDVETGGPLRATYEYPDKATKRSSTFVFRHTNSMPLSDQGVAAQTATGAEAAPASAPGSKEQAELTVEEAGKI